MAKAPFKPVLREAVIVAVVGAVLAFAANALSPRGLTLGRNYFPADNSAPAASSGGNTASTTHGVPPEEDVEARLKAKGLQTVNFTEARKQFDDPRYQQGIVLFIDVRRDGEYAEGHIPGAYHFDYYQPGNGIGEVMAACQPAQEIIIYCGGGHCDLSENAALMLRDDAKIPANKLFVYTGGITEWKEKRSPVEIGERNSGKLLEEHNGSR